MSRDSRKSHEDRYHTPEVTEHLLRSKFVPQTFKIKITQPMCRVDGTERLPVVYVADSDYFFGGAANLATILQGYGETPRFVLVGIGYENAGAAALLRLRDLLSHPIQKHFDDYAKRVAQSQFISDTHELDSLTKGTDAGDFLRFICEELMPLINSQYPVLPEDSNYFGYSAGGTFGLYTLFNRPDTFKRYVLGSPGTSLNGHHYGIELARAFVDSGKSLKAKVFMSVGELEEFHRGLGHFELTSGYYLMAKYLKQSAIPGLELTTRVFPGETHATSWTLAFAHGWKELFGPVERVPYWPESLK
jgi:uncharacterized protein